MPLTLVARLSEDDPGPVLTPPPNPSKPQPDRPLAFAFLATGVTPDPSRADIRTAMNMLRSEGWTAGNARAAIGSANGPGNVIAAALRNGPPLRLVRLAAVS